MNRIAFLTTAILFAAASVPAFANTEASDAVAASAISTRYAQDDTAPYIHADVAVSNGVATISGSARTRFARDAAVRLASETPGVSAVVSKIRVEPNP